MIRVIPCEKTEEIEALAGAGGDNLVYMSAHEGDKLIGAGAGTPDGEIVSVNGDDSAVELIIRSFINFFDRRGVREVISRNRDLYGILKKIGFLANDGIMSIDVNVFFGNST